MEKRSKSQLKADASLLSKREMYFEDVIKTIRTGNCVVKLQVESYHTTVPCWIIVPPDKAVSVIEGQLQECQEQLAKVVAEMEE